MLMSRRATADALPKRPVNLDRRGARRIHTVLRVARVTRAHDVGLWRLNNISDDGMMLHASLPVAVGEPLSVALSDSVEIEGKAVWWDGLHCGVAFDRPLDCAAVLERLVAEQKAPRYRPPRLPVSTRAIAYCEQGLHTVRVRNLSHHGAGITHDGCFREGMATKLAFETGQEYRGVVRWEKEGRAGLFLVESIPCAQLESAARF